MTNSLYTQSVTSAKHLLHRHSDCHAGYGTLCFSRFSQIYIVLLPEEKTDEQLMEAYRDGDIQAFDQLFSRFKDILYRYLARQSGNFSIAEEIFQDSWAAIIKHRKTYKVKSRFKTYLFHIAHNKLIDYYRSQKNSKDDIVSYDEYNEELYTDLDIDKGLEYQADVLNKHEYLLSLLNKLPSAQRDVFLMHEEAGMSLIEIAEIMSVSRDTVKSRLRYALQRLRQGMERFS